VVIVGLVLLPSILTGDWTAAWDWTAALDWTAASAA